MKIYYVFYMIAGVLFFTAHWLMQGTWSTKVKWSSFACIVLGAVIFFYGFWLAITTALHIKIQIGVV